MRQPAKPATRWSDPGALTDAGTTLLDPVAPEVYQQFLTAGLVPAHPRGYTPVCTACGTNPFVNQVASNGVTGTDTETTFLYNFPADSTWAEQLWNDTPDSWTVTGNGADGGPFPLSISYPRTVTVLLP